MFNNGEIWVRPGMDQQQGREMHQAVFSRTTGWPVGGGYPTAPTELSSGGNCTNCGGTGRHIIQDTDGSMKSVTCMACAGGGQSSL